MRVSPFRPAFAVLILLTPALAQKTVPWIEKSNQNTKLLIDIDTKYDPEEGSSEGLRAFDEQVSSFPAGRAQRMRADWLAAKKELETRRAVETDPLVRQDLDILIAAADRSIRAIDAGDKTFLPYRDVAGVIFSGMKTLLGDQIAAERHPAALVRLRKYTGMAPGSTPLVEQAEQRFREKLKTPGLLYPSRMEVQKDLDNTNTYITGIALLLEKYKVSGYEPVYARLKQQLTAYAGFVRNEILPHARTDFRLPPAIYAMNLDEVGVDYTPAELEKMAHTSFTNLQAQMQALANKIASEHHFKDPDYRAVVRELKKDQLKSEDVLPAYEKTLAAIENTVREHNLVTLPERPAIIRLATAAETAEQAAPHMQPAPLLNNHGERGAFVLPLEAPGADGTSLKYDDFSFAAATWTMTAHEARPGHELQFDTMVEKGVSQARALYAFNSTNVEGWGLYSEWFLLPYMPDDAKLISLQLRLLRAARAFLDPELQEGKVSPPQAMKILEDDVVCSKAFATEEVDRFTFRMPGQAVAYFDGFTRLLEIRRAVEEALGDKFDQRKFHDFILSQGLLPPALLKKAVLAEFVH